MTRKNRLFFGLIITLALIAGVVGSLIYHTGLGGRSTIPQEALAQLQDTSYKLVDNSEATLRKWQGKTLVVNFWATWCPPCRKEMPAFSRLHEKLAPLGVHFVGIGIDSPSAIKEFALQFPVSYPLLIGGSEGMEVMRQVGNPMASLPYTLVISPTGDAVFSQLGMIEEDILEQRLRDLTGAQNN